MKDFVNNEARIAWENFKTSGSIIDYMAYFKAQHNELYEKVVEEVQAEKQHESENLFSM